MERKKGVQKDKPIVAVDLFAGGGGLTLGLKQAGFLVSAAVELNSHAANVYAANHAGTVLFVGDIRSVSGTELIRTSPTNRIDLIAACPPCQGFSQLTAKYRNNDPRNELIFEFVRLVKEIRPRLCMMENVPGLEKKGAPLFDPAMSELRAFGYHITHEVLDVANYGVPQRRRRLVVLGSLDAEIAIPKPTHAEKPKDSLKPWVTVREAIGDFEKPMTLTQSEKAGGPARVGWNVIRTLSPQNIQRLRASRAGASRASLPQELRPKCHQGEDMGFANVYGRMSWDKPSPTITGGCTTLSKGRFGHPSLLRTISVREAAVLQTFPKDYVFETDFMDHVCSVIGNALPPRFAEILARACINTLEGDRND